LCSSPTLARNGLKLDRRIGAFDAQFVRWAKENEEARRLTMIPGIGAIVASALVAAVGQAESFERGRDLAAWLGLVPQQFTTGGKPKLLGISKRGNKYLRRQLIHGARAALPYVNGVPEAWFKKRRSTPRLL
jgi:transposase